jgi:hypothetical protein
MPKHRTSYLYNKQPCRQARITLKARPYVISESHARDFHVLFNNDAEDMLRCCTYGGQGHSHVLFLVLYLLSNILLLFTTFYMFSEFFFLRTPEEEGDVLYRVSQNYVKN